MASRGFTYPLKIDPSKFLRGSRESGDAAKRLAGQLHGVTTSSLDAREAALRLEVAQGAQARAAAAAAKAEQTYGKESLQSARAQTKLESATKRAELASLGKQKADLRAAEAERKHAAEADRLNTRTSALGGSLRSSAASAIKASAAFAGFYGAGAAIRSVGQATIGFDKSMRNVNSLAGKNERQFRRMKDQVLALAGPTAQAPQTLAEGLYDIYSSGFKGANALRILKAGALAASAGLTDTATSTKAVTAVLNAYRRPAKDASKVSDDLFQTVNLGVINFEQLSSTIGDVLPFASSLKVGLKEVGASISTMTKAGIGPEETMTRIKNVMVAMLKPGEGLSAAYKKLGVSSGEALIKQKGFQGALDALIGTTDGSKASVAALFPNIRALGGALALTGKNSKSANADLKAFQDTSGATAKVTAEQAKSFDYQWRKFKATLDVLKITVGTALLPEFTKLAKAGTKFAENVRKNWPEIQRQIAPVASDLKGVASSITGFVKRHPDIAKMAASFAIIGGATSKLLKLTGADGILKLAFNQFGNRGSNPANALWVRTAGGLPGKAGPEGTTRKLPPGAAVAAPVAATAFAAAANQSKTVGKGPLVGTGAPNGGGPLLGPLRSAIAKALGKQKAEPIDTTGFVASLKTMEAATMRTRLRIETEFEKRLPAVSDRVASSWQKLSSSGKTSFAAIQATVTRNMGVIRSRMDTQSSAGKDAVAQNFLAAERAISRNMSRGVTSTSTGMTQIKTLLAAALQEFGFTPEQAKRYSRGQDPLTGKDMASPTTGKAVGGWIGSPGTAGRDTVPTMLGVGEAVLNRHQQKYVDPALRQTYGFGLNGLFSRVQTPHYMASGGITTPRMEQGLGAVTQIGQGALDLSAKAARALYRRAKRAAPVGRMAALMNQIDAKGFPYVYGGGHGSFDGPYDCSGLVSAILHEGGFLGSPVTTDGLKVFGEAGDGKQITIGVRGSSGRNAHTMMKLGNRYLESGSGHGARWVSGWSGDFPIHRHPKGFARGGMVRGSTNPKDKDFVGWGMARGGWVSKKLSPRARRFAAALASQTGLDAGVISAWIFGEEGGRRSPVGHDDNNWLNVGWTDSGPTSATRLRGWSDPETAAKMTANWMRGGGQISKVWGKAAPGIQRILDTAGKGPAAQLSAITSSGWASNAYRGGLSGVYRQLKAGPKTAVKSAVKGKGGKKITKPKQKPKRMKMSDKWAKIFDQYRGGLSTLDGQFSLAELTPSLVDDLNVAAHGITYADWLVKQAAGWAKAGQPGAMEFLGDAKSALSGWQEKYASLRTDHPGLSASTVAPIWRGKAEQSFASYQAANAPEAEQSPLVDYGAQIAEELRLMRVRGEAVQGQEPVRLVANYLAELASGRLGSSATMIGQGPSTPGVVAAGYSR